MNVTLEKSLSANGVQHAAIKGVCYSTLTQTATKRLFKLKERLEDRYAAVSQGSRSKVLDDFPKQSASWRAIPTRRAIRFTGSTAIHRKKVSSTSPRSI